MMSFDGAVSESTKLGKKPSVLLGNGFSRSYDDSIFSYSAILKSARFARYELFIRKVFASLNTSDFERVIRLFVEMRIVLSNVPRTPKRVLSLLEAVEDSLKGALANTLAANHPEGPYVIPEEEYQNVNTFLSNFGCVYSLNYDLLLYWAKMHSEDKGVDDGFRDSGASGADYVTWEPENRFTQTVFYLHGALHLSDSGSEIRKFTWCRTGVRLKEQILVELRQDRYPIIVTEGHADAKKAKIFHNIYLAHAYKSLLSKGGDLFIFGASLGPHDEHILRALQESPIKRVFLGVWGDPHSDANRETIARATQFLTTGRRPKALHVFDAKSVKVWR